jgi:predicted N-acyltransferase
MPVKNKFIRSISDISNSEFKGISNDHNSPFMSYEFLKSLEVSGSASILSGWQPHHAVSYENEVLNGLIPLYLKNNSQGEFVFDHQWAHALEQANRSYYPKFLTALPYTPCETSKLITRSQSGALNILEAVKQKMIDDNIESWHVLFPNADDRHLLLDEGFIERYGYRFVWNNRDFEDFDDFLKIFTSRQRKNIKKEREAIRQLDIKFSTKEGENLELDDWNIFFKFYVNTYYQRMQRPYLNKEFFELIHFYKNKLRPILFFASIDDEVIAASLCFRDELSLYGRHWGAAKDVSGLHFECCYYQGIEYCIENGMALFDPGIQGEYKIRRGFEPKFSNSYHFILHDDFRSAIERFCADEKKQIMNYFNACNEYTPIKKEYRI